MKDNEIFKYFHLLKRLHAACIRGWRGLNKVKDTGFGLNKSNLAYNVDLMGFYQSYMNEENKWGLNTYVCEEVLVPSFTIRGHLVKSRMGGFQQVLEFQDKFKGHLESWTVVNKQHSDMCSEHPISWNTSRARTFWKTGDQFEKCEQFKHFHSMKQQHCFPECSREHLEENRGICKCIGEFI